MNRDAVARPWAIEADRPDPAISRFARANRNTPTDAERKLWRHLRRLEPDRTHFRRQVVIAGFIADFACHGAKLVVEVDGGQHCDNAADAARTAAIEAQGWRVIRFWNNDVHDNMEGVAIRIAEALSSDGAALSGTTPNPSPQGGGKKAP